MRFNCFRSTLWTASFAPLSRRPTPSLAKCATTSCVTPASINSIRVLSAGPTSRLSRPEEADSQKGCSEEVNRHNGNLNMSKK